MRWKYAAARTCLPLACAALTVALPSPAGARTAPSGLPYSSASARVVQAQPAPGSCHARGRTAEAQLPDPRCTPGAVNPAVTQGTIADTICRSGWTRTVRPSSAITRQEKLRSLLAYGEREASRYEYDHLVPLELGGAVNDARNLWPELDDPSPGSYTNPKDRLETVLKHRVCNGQMPLAEAQRLIARDWVAADRRFG